MPDLTALTAAARRLMPAVVAVAASDPRRDHRLLPGEVVPGVPARRREFAAGRSAARAALAALGQQPEALPMRADRAPLWPDGFCGSITHSATACLAAAAPLTALSAVGLDLESDIPLELDLWETVLLPQERAALAGQTDAGGLAKLIFSAKEAAYKAQYPLTETLFGFEVLRIALDPMNGTFAAEFQQSIAPFATGDRLHGRFARIEKHILTAVTI